MAKQDRELTRRRRAARNQPASHPPAAAPGRSTNLAAVAGEPSTWLVAALLTGFVFTSYWHAFSLVFISDDYIILNKTLHASFTSLWEPRGLLFNWYRPFSRELYYWGFQRLFGSQELPFHLASFALWVTCMMLFFTLSRRVTGARVAALATAAGAAMAAWAGPLLWVAGVQDLWMMLFAFLTLHAFARRRQVWAAALLPLALLSKETAGVLALLAFAWARLVDRESTKVALWRVLPLVTITVVWVLLHPRLTGRMLGAYTETMETVDRPSSAITALKTVLSLFNLEEWPAPESGWGPALLRGLPGLIVLVALSALALRGHRLRARPDVHDRAPGEPRVIALTACWIVLGWLPLFLPSIGWHAYYGLFGNLGAWLLIMHSLRRSLWIAFTIVAGLALLRPLRADTPSWDWASDAYQRRAGFFIRMLRDDLLRKHPTMAPHSRLYFTWVPRNIGWVAGDGPALRVWYRDSTLRGGYYSYYRPRLAAEPAGPDLFFRFDSTGVWVEVTKGPEDIPAGRAANPAWSQDHQELALLFGRTGDWAAAVGELQKLVAAVPENLEYHLNLGFCYARLGVPDSARAHYRAVAQHPRTSPAQRATAQGALSDLGP